MYAIPRMLGGIAALNRQWDTAEEQFRLAIDATRRERALPELGRTYLDHARMLATQAEAGSRARAIESLRLGFQIFVDLGMHPFVRQAKRVAEVLSIRLPAAVPRPVAHPDNLSEREVEVLVRLAQGHSRQKIASDLVLGQRTITGHLSSIFRKIGVSDEAAATAYALEQGLTPRATRGRQAQLLGPVAATPRALRIILVSDVVASGDLIRRTGDARAHELIRMHNTFIRRCLASHDGVEVAHTGDGIEAAFSSASRAVECAIAIQKEFANHNRENESESMLVRIGINAGEPIPTEGRLFGTAVHAAFGICARAQPGEILVSEVVQQLVAGRGFGLAARGRIELKGLGRVRVYGVAWREDGG
jgi:class 3 adenylate cyclase